jgi:hypothetical protein
MCWFTTQPVLEAIYKAGSRGVVILVSQTNVFRTSATGTWKIRKFYIVI